MATYLLTWNKNQWDLWDSLAQDSALTASGQVHSDRWSFGNRRTVRKGDRLFLMKLGRPPKGIMASGWAAVDEVTEGPHYRPDRAKEGHTAFYVDVDFDRVLNPETEQLLSVDDFQSPALKSVHWYSQASGIQISEEAAAQLEDLWARHLQRPGPGMMERTWRAILERRGQADFRAKLVEAYGCRCAITECDAESALEAAHIIPYAETRSHDTGNGLLLRADAHTLFDLNLLLVDPDNMSVLLADELRDTTYGEFHGRRLRLPTRNEDRPRKELLRQRWKAAKRNPSVP